MQATIVISPINYVGLINSMDGYAEYLCSCSTKMMALV